MALQHEGSAPYTSPSAVIEVVERFRERGLQTPFTVDVLIRAGVSEGLAPRTIHSLERLDLIDTQGEPTEALRGLQRAPSNEYRERFAEVVRAAYAPIFQYTDPSTDPLERVRDAFRPYTPHGQQGRMVTLFMGLCEYTGIVGSRPKPPTGTRAASGRPRRQTPLVARAREAIKAETSSTSTSRQLAELPETLIALMREAFPARGGTWTSAERTRFLKTFEVLLDFSFPVDDSPSTPTAEDGEGVSE